MTKTLIANTYQSFVDMCINELVEDTNIHCTFPLMTSEIESLKKLFIKNNGLKMTVTKTSSKLMPNQNL